jgi:carbon-monoxide dehydrogenase medium subunit
MIPSSFDYAAPKTLSEALSLLKQGGEDAKILAGGQSLIPLLKLRLASPSLLVDINNISALDFIRDTQGQLRIGALTRMADKDNSDLVRKR